jgi:rRNA-processing protein FCF1
VKVIFDTNFLMMPAQFNVDVFWEISRLLSSKYELFVPDKVIIELETIAKKGKLKEKKAAKIGLALAKDLGVLKTEGSEPDEAILSLVDRNVVVCTNDKRLRNMVKEKGGGVIFLRQKKYLEHEGGGVGLS